MESFQKIWIEKRKRERRNPLEASKVHLSPLKISDRVDNDVSQIDFSLQVSNDEPCIYDTRVFHQDLSANVHEVHRSISITHIHEC